MPCRKCLSRHFFIIFFIKFVTILCFYQLRYHQVLVRGQRQHRPALSGAAAVHRAAGTPMDHRSAVDRPVSGPQPDVRFVRFVHRVPGPDPGDGHRSLAHVAFQR